MIAFLVEANKFLYRFPDNIIVKDTHSGDMKLIEHCRDDFIYRNYYVGYRSLNGKILILRDNKPIWVMAYEGGAINHEDSDDCVRKIYRFVRQNLARSTVEQPIRGPAEFQDGKMHYNNSFFGSINKYNGAETVTLEDQRIIYRLSYSGGDVIF
ncbi:DUF5680 domain-containing protein [Acerihabitans arboris]|uniref:DUF5680 domain-containing protein n=1 Tax=Acerihabitans arboris TaxID=2691583 RepID=A0A845SFH9_9GAMM|nr:DUF5680 domain-containing protein [Acerihabitans arboris]NDL63590.1 hypothetical protein [Acerihabitans arboris]